MCVDIYVCACMYVHVCMYARKKVCTYELRRHVDHFFPHDNQLSQPRRKYMGCMYVCMYGSIEYNKGACVSYVDRPVVRFLSLLLQSDHVVGAVACDGVAVRAVRAARVVEGHPLLRTSTTYIQMRYFSILLVTNHQS